MVCCGCQRLALNPRAGRSGSVFLRVFYKGNIMGRKFTFPVAVAATLGAFSAGLTAVSTASASIAIGNAGFTTPTVASGTYDAANKQ